MTSTPGSAATSPVGDGALARLTGADLQQALEAARRLAEDDGVMVGADEAGQPEHLRIDPLPFVVSAAEWADLASGLRQRARLLDLLLADLYGDRTLLTRGLLPAEIVMGHPGFLPSAVGVPAHLFLTAADLGRDDEGRWCVVADRAQSPVGAGYAMAVRRIVSRALAAVHRETDVSRLRDFFEAMRVGLHELAAGAAEAPRVVMLTDPDAGESAFDEVFTATLLGFPVVRAEDLLVRGGRVWLRTTERPEPVDVILRRVEAGRADPLDLLPGSTAGVPGLVEAARRGVVTVANPVGAGVLENPALGAFLPAIARALLDEDLLLAPTPTWWCGDEEDRRYVRDHLDELILSPLAPSATDGRVIARELSEQESAQLWARVGAEPWAWSAQPVLPMLRAPVVTGADRDGRIGTLRTFTLAGADGELVMPGGLARFAATPEARYGPPLRRALVKDVWVLADETTEQSPEPPVRMPAQALTGVRPAGPVPLPPRAAENLYWLGRYAERAESMARLLLVADDLVEDYLGRPRTAGHAAMRAVLAAIDDLTLAHRYRRGRGRPPQEPVPPAPEDTLTHLGDLVFNARRAGTVRYCTLRAARATAQVRELLSSDTSLVFARLDRTLTGRRQDLATTLTTVIEAYLALAGISAEGLVRDPSWAFLDAGRRVERSQETLRVLRHTLAVQRPPRADRLVLEATLRARESLISHRRRTAERGDGSPHEVALELLLVDASNPRSVQFQLNRLREDLQLTPSAAVDEGLAACLELVEATPPARLAERPDDFTDYLHTLESQLRQVSNLLEAKHFRHPARQQEFGEQR